MALEKDVKNSMDRNGQNDDVIRKMNTEIDTELAETEKKNVDRTLNKDSP